MKNYKNPVRSFQLVRFFIDRIQDVEKQKNKILHANGVPMHYYMVFQIMLCTRQDELNTKMIADRYHKFYGWHIMQSSLSRTLKYLHEELGLVKYARNPFTSKYTYVALTPLGLKAKHIFNSSKDLDTLPRKVVDRLVATNGN